MPEALSLFQSALGHLVGIERLAVGEEHDVLLLVGLPLDFDQEHPLVLLVDVVSVPELIGFGGLALGGGVLYVVEERVELFFLFRIELLRFVERRELHAADEFRVFVPVVAARVGIGKNVERVLVRDFDFRLEGVVPRDAALQDSEAAGKAVVDLSRSSNSRPFIWRMNSMSESASAPS
jgi:hypothetical protein